MNLLAAAVAVPDRELLARIEALAGHEREATKEQIEALIAELAPRPDVPAMVRRLPVALGVPGTRPVSPPTLGLLSHSSAPPQAPSAAHSADRLDGGPTGLRDLRRPYPGR